jgi:hypothetical protein
MYKIVTLDSGTQVLTFTDVDEKIWWIPMDESNADYQAYLNKDKVNDEAETI